MRQLDLIGSRAILVHVYGVHVEGEAARVVVVLTDGNVFGEGFARVGGGMGDGALAVGHVDVIGGAQRYRLRGVVVLRREGEGGGRDGDVLVGVVACGGCDDADGNIRRGLGVDAHVVGRRRLFHHGDGGHVGVVLFGADAHLRVDFADGNRRGNIVEPSAAGVVADGWRAVGGVRVALGPDGDRLRGVPVGCGEGQRLGAGNLDIAGRWVLRLRYGHGNVGGRLVAQLDGVSGAAAVFHQRQRGLIAVRVGIGINEEGGVVVLCRHHDVAYLLRPVARGVRRRYGMADGCRVGGVVAVFHGGDGDCLRRVPGRSGEGQGSRRDGDAVVVRRRLADCHRDVRRRLAGQLDGVAMRAPALRQGQRGRRRRHHELDLVVFDLVGGEALGDVVVSAVGRGVRDGGRTPQAVVVLGGGQGDALRGVVVLRSEGQGGGGEGDVAVAGAGQRDGHVSVRLLAQSDGIGRRASLVDVDVGPGGHDEGFLGGNRDAHLVILLGIHYLFDAVEVGVIAHGGDLYLPAAVFVVVIRQGANSHVLYPVPVHRVEPQIAYGSLAAP